MCTSESSNLNVKLDVESLKLMIDILLVERPLDLFSLPSSDEEPMQKYILSRLLYKMHTHSPL